MKIIYLYFTLINKNDNKKILNIFHPYSRVVECIVEDNITRTPSALSVYFILYFFFTSIYYLYLGIKAGFPRRC